MNLLYSDNQIEANYESDLIPLDYFEAKKWAEALLSIFWEYAPRETPVDLLGIATLFNIDVVIDDLEKKKVKLGRRKKRYSELAGAFDKEKQIIYIHQSNQHYTRWRIARGIAFILHDRFTGQRLDYFSKLKADPDGLFLNYLAMNLTMPAELNKYRLKGDFMDTWKLVADNMIASDIAHQQARYLNLTC